MQGATPGVEALHHKSAASTSTSTSLPEGAVPDAVTPSVAHTRPHVCAQFVPAAPTGSSSGNRRSRRRRCTAAGRRPSSGWAMRPWGRRCTCSGCSTATPSTPPASSPSARCAASRLPARRRESRLYPRAAAHMQAGRACRRGLAPDCPPAMGSPGTGLRCYSETVCGCVSSAKQRRSTPQALLGVHAMKGSSSRPWGFGRSAE